MCLLVACGGTEAPPTPETDAPSTSFVNATLLAPNGGETFEAAMPTTIRWSAVDETVMVELVLFDEAGETIAIARELPTTPGQAGSFEWSPPGVPAPARYKVRLTMSLGDVLAADESDDFLTITPPATGVSLARDLGPIFTAKCNSALCHSTATQASGLDLTLGKAHKSLVGVKSRHTACNTFDRVAPGSPTTSFLVFKLQGNGACFAGVRMPKGMGALPAAQIQLVRDWISEGAKNN